MSKLGCIRLIIMLFAGLITGQLLAQSPGEDQANPSAQTPVAAETSQAPQQELERPIQYAAALNGTGLIPMDNTVTSHLLLGATTAGGWDSNPNNLGSSVSSGIYNLSPYFGIQASTPKTQALFQYQPTVTGYTSSYARQSMHIATAKIVSNVNERWNWDLKASGSYGQDSVRFLTPQTVAVGEVPGTGPNSASYLPNAGTVTYVDGSVGVNYRASERDLVAISVANSFSHYAGFSDSSSIATGNLSYMRDLSPTLGITVYGQSSYYYGALNCASFGAGVGFHWRASENTLVSLSGGPQVNTSACNNQQLFSYSAAFSTRLSGKSQIYLMSARQPTTSYLGPGLWQTSASGGYQRQVTAIGTLSFDVGYVGSDTLTAVNSYHGTYLDCIYSYHLAHGLNLSYSYRGYVGATGGTNFTRHVAMFSLAWTPNAGHIFQ